MSRPNRAPALKCQRCRDDRQACLPRDRAWLERDCDRCIHYHYRCGPSLPKSHEPTSGAVDDGEYLRRMGLVNRVALSSDGHYSVYACMASLERTAWDYAGLFDAAEPEESSLVGFNAVAIGAFKGEMYAPNLVLFRLWERGEYIRAHDKFDELYRAHLPNANASEAKRLATAQYVQEVCNSQISKGSQISTREDVEGAVHHILRQGARWRSLVVAIGSAEVLLMDDRLYVGVKRSIGDIIRNGTSEEFDKLKDDLLIPEGQMQNICLALSGVSEMMFQLADSPKDSKIRQYLASAITGRLDSVFGQPGPDTRRDPDGKCVIPFDYLMRCIADIFGISIRFTTARGTPADTDRSSLSLREQWERLTGVSHQDQDMHDSIEVEDPQGSSNPGSTPPGTYAGSEPKQ